MLCRRGSHKHRTDPSHPQYMKDLVKSHAVNLTLSNIGATMSMRQRRTAPRSLRQLTSRRTRAGAAVVYQQHALGPAGQLENCCNAEFLQVCLVTCHISDTRASTKNTATDCEVKEYSLLIQCHILQVLECLASNTTLPLMGAGQLLLPTVKAHDQQRDLANLPARLKKNLQSQAALSRQCSTAYQRGSPW